jgi:tetratricopeptide (TPR) repeat protein
MDPLDWWARDLSHMPITCDLQATLDIAHDYARAGFNAEAIALLENRIDKNSPTIDAQTLPDQSWGAMPMVLYTLGWLQARSTNASVAAGYCRRASEHSPDYCFPSRLEEIGILEFAMRTNQRDAKAAYYLGNLLYDRRRHREAIAMWQRSVKIDPHFSIPWRNLGIGHFNILRNPTKARSAYDKALAANPKDARLLYERDQLWKRIGVPAPKRLRELERRRDLVDLRDDLTIELASLDNQTGNHQAALELLTRRHFQPWEGGEGAALGQFVRTHLSLGRIALNQRDADAAIEHFQRALVVPHNLGEAKHLLANQSDIHYWLGVALEAAGRDDEARSHWKTAAEFKGDFQNMSVRVFSEMTYYSALSLRRLGRKRDADKLLRQLLTHAKSLFDAQVEIDYFATSLPTMLLFEDDLKHRQQTASLFIQAQARAGLGEKGKARTLLKQVLTRDPNHALAADLLGELDSK